MTGLQRRLAEREAKEKLRRDIDSPSLRTPGHRYSAEELVDDAVEAFEKKLKEGEKKFRSQQWLHTAKQYPIDTK